MSENKYGLDLEIGGLWYIPFWKTTVFYFIIGIILIFLLLLVLYKLWRWKSKKPAQDPIVMLVQSLRERENKLEKIDAQVFYLDLIFKFKKFIGYKYQLELINKTDSEVKKFLVKDHSMPINHELINTFVEVLDSSYTARFAKNAVNKDKMGSDLQKTIHVMQQMINENCEKL